MDTAADFVSLADAAARAFSLLCRFIEDWQNAPSDVCELRDDINRLSSLLESVRHLATTGRPMFNSNYPDAVASLSQDIASARRCLDRIRLLITSLQDDDLCLDGRQFKPWHILWKTRWLGRRRDITEVRGNLRECIQIIVSRLVLLNMTVSADIYAAVGQHENNMDNRHRHLIGQINTRFNELSSAFRVIGGSNVQPALRILPRTAQTETQLHRLKAANVLPSTGGLGVYHRGESQQSQQRDSCCRCSCHYKGTTRYNFGTFAASLGTFSFRFERPQPTFQAQLCKLNCCVNKLKRHPFRRLAITYSFPSWLFLIAVTAAFTKIPSPELLLRIHRRVPRRFDASHSNLTGYAIMHKVDEARHCLQQGTALVTDIVDESGESPLDLAISGALSPCSDMAVLLVRAGADIFQETSKISGPSCCAFVQNVYANPRLPRTGSDWREFEQLIPMNRILSYMELSALHEIILGIRYTDIRDLLRQEGCVVDACDVTGQTALYYATVRGDLEGVRALLEAGAQPDFRGSEQFEKDSVLSEACRHGHIEIVRLLLAAGADSNGSFGPKGRTPMHFLGGNGKIAIQIATELLRRGANIEAEDIGGSTPLHFACYSDAWELVEFLLCAGPCTLINYRDYEGTTPLECAVAMSSCRTASVLLKHGADYTNIDTYGHNVLHHLGVYSNAAMMEVFISSGPGGLAGLDITRRNIHGRTPLQLFNSRANVTAELHATFKRLLDTAYSQGFLSLIINSVEEDEMFFDALEA